MPDRRHRPTDPELERALIELGPRLAYPPTPDLATSVSRRLLEQPAHPRPWWQNGPPARRLAYALVVLLALVAALLALWPAGRAAVAQRLGIRGVEIFHEPAPTPTVAPTPTLAPGAVPSPTRAPLGERLGLGQRLPLAEARARAPFSVVLPTLPEYQTPDEVYFGEPPRGGQVSLVYQPRPGLPPAPGSEVGLLLTEFRGDLDPRFYGKLLGSGVRLDELTVDGERALWIEGQPHVFIYRDRSGNPVDEQVRLAGNVLLWERGDLTLRLEGAPTKAEALRIAASVK